MLMMIQVFFYWGVALFALGGVFACCHVAKTHGRIANVGNSSQHATRCRQKYEPGIPSGMRC